MFCKTESLGTHITTEEGRRSNYSSAEGGSSGEPRHKKRYGDLSVTLNINKEKLLGEARTWSHDKSINWSQLAREYGIQYIWQNDIPAASIQQRSQRKPRRCKRRVDMCTNTPMPMYPTVMHEEAKLQECIIEGEIVIGVEVVPTVYDYYSFDSETYKLQAKTINVCARRNYIYQ